MMEKEEGWRRLGAVFYSASVQAVLDDADISPNELLQFHLQREDAEAATGRPDWKCTSFDLEHNQQTIWIITDPQQQSTTLVLEEP